MKNHNLRTALILAVLGAAITSGACGSDEGGPSPQGAAGAAAGGSAGGPDGGTGGLGAQGGDAGAAGQSTGGAGGAGQGGASGAGAAGAAGSGPVTAAQLLALVQSCEQLSGTTEFATDDGEADTVPVCGLNGAVWWTSDMDIDCDGGQSAACKADPWYLPETSATDSQGKPLDASTLPFVVVPLPSNGFDYPSHGIALGNVAAVIYDGKLQYAIFADEGPQGIIGEGSYALAQLLGIDPDPATGGTDGPVTFIVFTGATAKVQKNEEHAEAVQAGQTRAAQLIAEN